MSKRLQELQYHPLGGNVPENAILLIKDNTTADYYEDYKLSFQDFTQKLIRQVEASTTPAVNQIPRLVSGAGAVPALPAISAEFLLNVDTAMPIGTDVVFGKLKLSSSTSSTSGTTGGFAATPAAVKTTYDAAAKKATVETVTANWTFSGSGVTFSSPIKLAASGATVGRDATGAFLKNDGTDYLYMKHSGGVSGGLVLKVGSTEYRVFHEGNDGPSSGLDADTVDGYHGAALGVLAENETVTGSWNFSGTTTTIFNAVATSLSVTNRAILTGGADLGNTLHVQTNARVGVDATNGAYLQHVASSNAIAVNALNRPQFLSGANTYNIFHSGFMGVTAGLDAGTLDGAVRASFAELAENETITGAWTFSGNAVFNGTLTGTLTGSASSLTTARTINGTSFNGTANITTANWGTARNLIIGNATKSVNGSANITWTLAEIGALGETANAVSATKLQTARLVNGTAFDGTADITTNLWGTSRNITIGSTTKAVNGSADVSWSLAEIGALGATATAVAATKLETPRAINGTNFDGTAAITTSLWGTARTLTIGLSGKSVNGSANVSWTLAEIGALALTGGTLTGTLTGTRYEASDTYAFVKAGGIVQGMFMDTTRTIIGGPSASGAVHLRPQGLGATTGEMIVNSNGTITAAADGTASGHLVRKGQMDTALALKANLAGAIFTGKVTFNGSDSGVNIQGGTGASGSAGDFRYNPTSQEFEGYFQGEWRPIGGGTGVTWIVANANATAEVGSGYLINSGGLTITLPATPEAGESIGIGDYNGQNFSVTVARNGSKIMGRTEDFTFNLKNANIVFSYVDSTVGWILTQGFGESQAPQAIANKLRRTNSVGMSTFSMPNEGTATVDVWYNGLKLDPATDYTADAIAGTVTLTVPVSANDDIIEFYNWNQALVLNADKILYNNITSKLTAVTMQAAIDELAVTSINKNKFINGGMSVWQRGSPLSAPAGSLAFGPDRFFFFSVGAPTTATLFDGYNNLDMQVTGQRVAAQLTSSGTPTLSLIGQRIEGANCNDLFNRKVTFSAWVFSTVATSSVTWQVVTPNNQDNYASGGTTIASGTFPAIPAQVWTKVTFTFTGAHSCALGTSVELRGFDLTSGRSFFTTGWQLELGERPTRFEYKLYPEELASCRRYYETGYFYSVGYVGVAAGQPLSSIAFMVEKRAVPTVGFSGVTYANCNSISANPPKMNVVWPFVTGTATANAYAHGTYTANAEIA